MNKARTPFDALSRASFNQMREGKVLLQALAIFTVTGPDSVDSARQQIELYLELLNRYKEQYALFTGPECFSLGSEKVHVIPAFENASGFCSENEPLEKGLARLQHLYEKLKRILYISLTWDGENRFGGGNATTVGLKEDGKQLLRWMDGKRIAIDFSHTSDALARDILNFTQQQNLKIPVLASHSNFRAVTNVARNLPDEIAQEIIGRGGIIGLNLFSPFIGPEDPKNLAKHAEHAMSLNGENALSFGADFFCDADFPNILTKYKRENVFFDEFGNSSKYPHILEMFKQDLKLSPSQLEDLAHQNTLSFLSRK